jgi:hypothetical protein
LDAVVLGTASVKVVGEGTLAMTASRLNPL